MSAVPAEYKFLSVRCERELLERLEKVSRESERTVSAQTRLALREHIERAEREPREHQTGQAAA